MVPSFPAPSYYPNLKVSLCDSITEIDLVTISVIFQNLGDDSPFLAIFEYKGESPEKMDAIFGNFRKNETKYVAEFFFYRHRNRFCQCSMANSAMEHWLLPLWGRTLRAVFCPNGQLFNFPLRRAKKTARLRVNIEF